jgi:hypothetical protein
VPNHDGKEVPTLDFVKQNENGKNVVLYAKRQNHITNDYTIIPIMVTETNLNGFEYRIGNP